MTEASVLIVTSTFKRPLQLLRAGHSIIGQKYNKWRWHIVDDCSNDDGWTESAIRELKRLDSRISSSYNSINCGATDSKRPYMMNATSDYLASLDDDDWWEDAFLSILVRTGQMQKRATIVYSDCWAVNDRGYRYWDCSKGKPFPNILPSCAVMRTRNYIDAGGWDVRLKDYHAEAELYIKVGGPSRLHHVKLPLAYWSDNSSTMSKNPLKSGKGLVMLVSMHPEMSNKDKATYLARAGLHFTEGGDSLTGEALFHEAIKTYPLNLEGLSGYIANKISSKVVVLLGQIYRKWLGMSSRVYKVVPPQWWKE